MNQVYTPLFESRYLHHQKATPALIQTLYYRGFIDTEGKAQALALLSPKPSTRYCLHIALLLLGMVWLLVGSLLALHYQWDHFSHRYQGTVLILGPICLLYGLIVFFPRQWLMPINEPLSLEALLLRLENNHFLSQRHKAEAFLLCQENLPHPIHWLSYLGGVLFTALWLIVGSVVWLVFKQHWLVAAYYALQVGIFAGLLSWPRKTHLWDPLLFATGFTLVISSFLLIPFSAAITGIAIGVALLLLGIAYRCFWISVAGMALLTYALYEGALYLPLSAKISSVVYVLLGLICFALLYFKSGLSAPATPEQSPDDSSDQY